MATKTPATTLETPTKQQQKISFEDQLKDMQAELENENNKIKIIQSNGDKLAKEKKFGVDWVSIDISKKIEDLRLT